MTRHLFDARKPDKVPTIGLMKVGPQIRIGFKGLLPRQGSSQSCKGRASS